MADNGSTHHDGDAELDAARRLYANCKRKGRYRNGNPRPCRSQRCPCEVCRRKYSEKQSAILQRSFAEKPPDYTFVLEVVDSEPVVDVQMAIYLKNFTQHIRDFRKSDSVAFEYEIRIEFKDGHPHCHATVITPLGWAEEAVKELARGWWVASCPGRQVLVYAKPVRNVVGHAKYVTKDVIDRSEVEMPPDEWNGKKCKFVRRSAKFLVRPAEDLWREQRIDWYGPLPESLDSVNGEIEVDGTEVDCTPPDEPVNEPTTMSVVAPLLSHNRGRVASRRAGNRFRASRRRRLRPLPRAP